MNCEDITELYLKSLRTELSFDESKLLEEHLSSCGKCRNELKWDSAIISAVRRAQQTIPHENFVSEVCKQLPLPNLSNEPYYTRFMIFSAVMAAAGVVMAVLWSLLGNNIDFGLLEMPFKYFVSVINKIQSFHITLPESSLIQEIQTIVPPNFTWLIWIVFAGSIYFIVSMLFPIFTYSYNKK